MSDKKISELTAATTPLSGTEVLPIVQSGVTKKVATDDLTVKNLRSNATTGILQMAGVTAGQTRVVTVPDANFTAARTDAAQSFTGDQTLGTGNLVIGTAGKGIDFSADGQAAGMTSELLDDYEEGTFTPTVVGTTTAGTGIYNARTGVYTKVGDTVFFQLWINMSAHTGTGNFRITGLPFVSANIAGVVNAYSGAVGYCTGLAIPADGTVIWYVGTSQSQVDLYRNSISTAVSSAVLPLDPASQVQITGWYKAA